MNKWLIGLMIVVLAFCGGCQTYTNLQPAYLYDSPTVNVYQDPDIDWNKYKTFSVFPFSLLEKESKLNPIAQKQILFFIRNVLESKGYKLVKPDKKPDFLLTVNFDCKYASYYVPPQSITLPQYIPGKTITTYQNTYGNVNTYGDVNIWGTYSGHSTATTYIPGYTTTQTYTRPGYTVGHYYPSALILIYDGATYQEIWRASGAGTSDNSDFRISGQLVLMRMLKDLPDCKDAVSDLLKNHPELLRGYIGIYHLICTIDGNNYFPSLMKVWPNSPAKRAWLKQEDIIISINGEPTVNKSWFQIWEMLSGPGGTELNLKIWRVGKTIDKKIIKAKRPVEEKK